MATPSKVETITIDDMAFPYITNDAPVGDSLRYSDGLNVLTSINGRLVRRPGFSAALESVPTTFTNVKNIHVWQRWDDPVSGTTQGAFIAMINDCYNGQSLVYKYQIGTDLSAVLIHADQSSEDPFFFVDSNNQCYMGNGHAGHMLRYDGTTLLNWGIAAPASAPNVHFPVGQAPSGGGGGTITSTGKVDHVEVLDPGLYNTNGATVAFVGGGGSGAIGSVTMSVFGFDGGPQWGVASISVINGGSGYTTPPEAVVTGNGGGSSTATFLSSQGSTTTTGSSATVSTAVAFDSYTVNQGTLPDLTLYQHIKYTTAAPHGFSVGQFVAVSGNAVSAFNLSGFIESVSAADEFLLDFFQEASVTTGAGGTATSSSSNIPQGIKVTETKAYCITYGYGDGTGNDAISIGESSPSLVSSTVGPFSNGVPLIDLIPSPDPQVNQIHVYATTDGGALDPEEMREIDGSPFANFAATVVDTTSDDFLAERDTAPAFNRNDPPTPSIPLVAYASRIWTKQNNTLYYSGFEEISRGVPEECFPSGLDGNNHPYAKQIRSMAALPDGVDVSLSNSMQKVEGDSLENFRFYTLLEKRGTISEQNMSSIGGSVSWIDTSGTIWNSELGEIGVDVRPDTSAMDQTKTSITVHIAGNFHWIIVMDGKNGRLLVFDIDKKQWIPPWQVGNTVTAIGSFETSDGVTSLLIARNGSKIMKLTPGVYNDDGDVYSAFVSTQQFNVSPKQLKGWRGVIDWIEWKRNTTALLSVKQLTDDNPALGTFKDITDSIQPSPDITQGVYLLTERASSNYPTSQLATIRFEWPAEDKLFEMYQISIASHPVGV